MSSTAVPEHPEEPDHRAGQVARALPGFFLLTFAATWTAWLVWASAPFNALFLLGVFAPALVALALTAYGEGRTGVTRLLARIGKWRVPARWYVFAIGYMAATRLSAALVVRWATGAWPDLSGTPFFLMLVALLVSTWVQAGEEIGWRGYALPRLAAHLGLGGAAVLLGVIWALWHLPLFLLRSTPSHDNPFPIYLLYVTAISVAMSWLYWKTEGSLLLTMVMHASVNNTFDIVPAAGHKPMDPMSLEGPPTTWAIVGVAWVIAVLLLFRMRGARLGGGHGRGQTSSIV